MDKILTMSLALVLCLSLMACGSQEAAAEPAQQIQLDYEKAVSLMDDHASYNEAIAIFETLGDYKDSLERIEACNFMILERDYGPAIALCKAGDYEAGILKFREMGSDELANKTAYFWAEELLASADKARAAMAFYKAGDYSDARARSFSLWNEISDQTIAAAPSYTLAITGDNKVIAAGDNAYSDGSPWQDVVAISASSYRTAGIKADGTLLTTAAQEDKYVKDDWKDLIAVCAGYKHITGLKADGTVVAFGENEDGQCNVSGWTDITAISASTDHTLGLRSDGTVVVTGGNSFGECDVTGWTDIIAISTSELFTLGLRSDGTVVTAGMDEARELVSGWKNIKAISAGQLHAVGLTAEGTVLCAGDADYGSASGWEDIVAIHAGWNSVIGLKANGSVIALGPSKYGHCKVSNWPAIKVPQA